MSDSNGCGYAEILTLEVRQTSQDEITNESICSSELPYVWNGQTITQSGEYTNEVIEGDGCSYNQILILSVNELEISGVIADPSCNPSNGIGNGSIIINMIGGQAPFIYQWSSSNGSGLETNSKDQSGLTGGTYVLRVTDSNGCIEEGTFTLVHPNIISLLANTTQPTCAESRDGAIAITATGGTGGYSYAWSTIDGSGLTNNTEDQVALSGGTFIVTVTDASGCSIIDQYVLTQPEPLESEETSKTVCEIDLPYEWNGMSLADSGVYTIDVTTNSGCNRQEILNLTVITELPGEPEVITICPEELPYTHCLLYTSPSPRDS